MKKYTTPTLEEIGVYSADVITMSGFETTDSHTGDSYDWNDYAKKTTTFGDFT